MESRLDRVPRVLAYLAIAGLAGACSLINAPDDIQPGGGGDGGAGAAGAAGGEAGSGNATACETNDDCAELTDACNSGICGSSGTCTTEPAAAGTPCGDPADGACTDPDSCDGAGSCVANDAPNGTYCDDCNAGPGACSFCKDGACGDCAGNAVVNTFQNPAALEGWEVNGGWGLYRRIPDSYYTGGQPFPKQVFGTDGNLQGPHPGPGLSNLDINQMVTDMEDSFARTPPTTLPATLEFLSWHQDEGYASSNIFDTKSIHISTDGGQSFTPVVDCSMPAPLNQYPFCQGMLQDRPPDQWDTISVDISPFQGQVGIVEFRYQASDFCCGVERGWYIDRLNVATRCACSDATDCAVLDTECSGATCSADGECVIEAPAELGTACGDATATSCDLADACDGMGYCDASLRANASPCGDCDNPAMGCACSGTGMCSTCTAIAPTNDFNTPQRLAGWELTGDWRLYDLTPPAANPALAPADFLAPFGTMFGSALGTDGNRAQPYPGMEAESSSALSPAAVIPSQITFLSWHRDEGGGGGFDNKIVEISTDGGQSFVPLVNCNGGPNETTAFCTSSNPNTPRAGNQWDSITLNTGILAGQVGQIRFRYETGDENTGFEQGWYINDLNFAQPCAYFGPPM